MVKIHLGFSTPASAGGLFVKSSTVIIFFFDLRRKDGNYFILLQRCWPA